MPPVDAPFHLPAVAADFTGTLLIAGGVGVAVARLLRGRGLPAARHTVADAAVTGLGLKTAAALLRTAELRTWEQLGTFAAVLALRLALKRVFVWEVGRTREPPADTTSAPSDRDTAAEGRG